MMLKNQKQKIRKKKNNVCIRCGSRTYKNNLFCSECFKKPYIKNYQRKRRVRKMRYVICKICGTSKSIMPFVGVCNRCYHKVFHAIKSIRRGKSL